MIARFADYGYIAATLLLTAYGQLMLKARIPAHGPLPAAAAEKVKFLLLLLLDPLIMSALFAAFLASLAWMAALSKFPLSEAYPFMSLNFVLVLGLSGWLLGEPLNPTKLLGVALIVLGTLVASRA